MALCSRDGARQKIASFWSCLSGILFLGLNEKKLFFVSKNDPKIVFFNFWSQKWPKNEEPSRARKSVTFLQRKKHVILGSEKSAKNVHFL